jgi:CBS domain containing-hemolysin-like protein
MIALRLFAIFSLIAVNGFFAAVEISLVAVRLSWVRQMVKQGDPRARIVELLVADLGRVISGVQVGITLAGLALGYLGEVTLANMLRPMLEWIPGRYTSVLAHSVAFVLAFGLLTVLLAVLGELVPKTLSLARTERVALLVARPFHWYLHTFRWAIDALDGAAAKIVGWMGVREAQSHSLIRSPEELQILVEHARERGLLQAGEEKFIRRAMELSQVQVREVMVPRPDMHVLPAGAGLEETMQMFATTQRSRIPVYEGTLDHILGFVHIKDIIWVLQDRLRRAEERLPPPEFQLRRLLREVLIVPETKPASELLVEFRAKRAGLAVVVDEHGSILGLATLEDILEQMVGEIHDEFDVVERPLVLADGSTVFDARLNVRDLETQYNIALPDDPAYETIGGFVLSRLGFIPRGGESIEAAGYRFTVLEMDRRRVSRVKVRRVEAEAQAPAPAKPAKPAKPAARSKARSRE